MDVQRNADAAGLMAFPVHRPLFNTASANQTSAQVSLTGGTSSLAGGAVEGGLLATFDAIFRQTLAPQPSALSSPPPTPSDRAASYDHTPPERLGSRDVSASDEDESEDDDREPAERATIAANPPPAAASEIVADPVADAEENVEASEASPAVAGKADSEEEEAHESAAAAAEAAAALDEEDAESDVDASPASELAPSTLPTDAAVNEPAAAAPESADAVPASEPSLPQNVEALSQEAAQADVQAAVRAAAKGVDSASAVSQDARTPPPGEGELPAPTEKANELVQAERGDANPEEASTEELRTTTEGTSDQSEPSDAQNRDGRDSRNRDENPQQERNEASGRQANGERRAVESASRGGAIEHLVAQMQPLEQPVESIVTPPQGAQPATIAATTAASAAVNSAAAVKSDAGDSATASGDSLGLDGGEPRRSVGGVKGDAAEGNAQTQSTSNADRVRLIQRVARAFQRLGPDGGRVQVMLHPAALGSVRLDLRIDGNRMDARMTAESEAARSVLREHLPELRQRLADSGLVVERIDIEVDSRASGEGEHRGQGGGEDSSWRRGPQATPPLQRTPLTPATPPTRRAPPPAQFASSAGLDLMA